METDEQSISWIHTNLPKIMRRLVGQENLEAPVMQLPLAQLRLAHLLFESEEINGETMSRLAEKLGVRHSALTQAADRLIHNGLAERIPDKVDRRVVRLRLIAKGQEWIGDKRRHRRERLASLWQSLSPEQQIRLLEAIHVLDETTSSIDISPREESRPIEETVSRTQW